LVVAAVDTLELDAMHHQVRVEMLELVLLWLLMDLLLLMLEEVAVKMKVHAHLDKDQVELVVVEQGA
tara:strand:+ start:417 stop:617 length:201 start_codon:yes stop_codon:yes gene_type:complete